MELEDRYEFWTIYDAFASLGRSYADSYDSDIEIIVQADQLGYSEAWTGEHITETWENVQVPELLMSKALAMTENIVLATGVTMLPLYYPVDTARRIAM